VPAVHRGLRRRYPGRCAGPAGRAGARVAAVPVDRPGAAPGTAARPVERAGGGPAVRRPAPALVGRHAAGLEAPQRPRLTHGGSDMLRTFDAFAIGRRT